MNRPTEPELRATQRAVLTLEFTEAGELVHTQDEGWARLLDNGWLLWKDDEMERWQCWPPQHVIAVEWVGSDE